jgi:toxin YoeB
LPRRLDLTPRARADLEWWRRTRPRTRARLQRLLEAILADPFAGLGKPEPLRQVLPNTWSRRITGEHRLVYRVFEDRIEILAARYHY